VILPLSGSHNRIVTLSFVFQYVSSSWDGTVRIWHAFSGSKRIGNDGNPSELLPGHLELSSGLETSDAGEIEKEMSSHRITTTSALPSKLIDTDMSEAVFVCISEWLRCWVYECGKLMWSLQYFFLLICCE
jgi:hypothetical protein